MAGDALQIGYWQLNRQTAKKYYTPFVKEKQETENFFWRAGLTTRRNAVIISPTNRKCKPESKKSTFAGIRQESCEG